MAQKIGSLTVLSYYCRFTLIYFKHLSNNLSYKIKKVLCALSSTFEKKEVKVRLVTHEEYFSSELFS